MLVEMDALALLQVRTVARSEASPRVRRAPDRGHAALWLPSVSRGLWHQQL